MGHFFTSWKTSLTGILTGGPVLLCQLFHVCQIGHFGNTDWLSLISGVGAILMGATAKDADKSNSPTPTPTAKSVP